jgi:translocation and assembly module TamB
LYSNQAIESLSQLGANFTTSEGYAIEASSLDFTIDLNSLAELYPDLKGQVKAQGQISGLVQSPKIVMQANINDLVTGSTRLQKAFIDLSVDMENKLMSKAEVNLVDLFLGGQTIPKLTFALTGDESEQSVWLKVPEGKYLTEHLIKGKLNAQRSAWSGQWLKGLIETNLVELELQEQAKLEISFQPFSLYLGKHCWAGRGDKLCLSDVNATQQSASAELSIDYNVMNPGMAELLPSIDVAASDLDITVDAEVNWQPQTGVSFLADIAALNSTLLANENRVTVENIIAQIKGTPTNISSRFTFDSTEAGQVSISSQLDLASQTYQHEGSLQISEFSVSYFAPFISAVKRLNGDINADVTFNGPIDKPSLQGELTLADGAFVLKEYPLRLTKYNQNLVKLY